MLQPSAISLSSRTKSLYDSLNRLLAFRSGISLASEVGSGGAGFVEESRKDWLDEGSEDDLSAIGHRKSHPEDEDKLKGVVERKPVDSIDQALENVEEGINDPICQPLSIIHLAGTEKSVEGIVTRNDEAGKVDEKLATDVEENEEEVKTG